MMNANCISHKGYYNFSIKTDGIAAMLDTSIVEKGVIETAVKLYNPYTGGFDWYILNRTRNTEQARNLFENWDKQFSVNPKNAAAEIRGKYFCDCTTF